MPRPWAMPPWSWPSTRAGLMARPTSWAATIRRTFTVPSSGSTSTTATWAPNAYVSYGTPCPSASSGVVFGSYEPRPSSTQPRPAAGSSGSSTIETASPSRTATRPRVDLQCRLGPGLGEGQQLAAQVLRGEPRRVPRHERLPRGRGLAGVGRVVRVRPDALDRRDRHAEGVGGDLGEDGVRALADVGRPGEQDDACRRHGCRPRSPTGWTATCCRSRTTRRRRRPRAGPGRRRPR